MKGPDGYGAHALINSEVLDVPGGLLTAFNVDKATVDLSVSGLNQAASEALGSAFGCLTGLSTNAVGGLMMILVAASGLLAVGTNAVCYRQARIRRLTPNRS